MSLSKWMLCLLLFLCLASTWGQKAKRRKKAAEEGVSADGADAGESNPEETADDSRIVLAQNQTGGPASTQGKFIDINGRSAGLKESKPAGKRNRRNKEDGEDEEDTDTSDKEEPKKRKGKNRKTPEEREAAKAKTKEARLEKRRVQCLEQKRRCEEDDCQDCCKEARSSKCRKVLGDETPTRAPRQREPKRSLAQCQEESRKCDAESVQACTIANSAICKRKLKRAEDRKKNRENKRRRKCRDQEQKCRQEDCVDCCLRTDSPNCLSLLGKEAPSEAQFTLPWCVKLRDGCRAKTCKKCCRHVKSAGCKRLLSPEKWSMEKNSDEWCQEEQRKCSEEGCDRCCRNSRRWKCRDAVEGWCEQEKQKCEADPSCKNCCKKARSRRCSDSFAEHCSAQKKACDAAEMMAAPCDKCCEKANGPKCQAALNPPAKTEEEAGLEEEEKAKADWCVKMKRRCRKSRCPRCCREFQTMTCGELLERPSFSEEAAMAEAEEEGDEGDDAEEEEEERVEGEPVNEPDISDINEIMRGEAAIAALSVPVGIRSKTGELVTIQLEKAEDLRQVIATKNLIKRELARVLGLGDSAGDVEDDRVVFAGDMMITTGQAEDLLRELRESGGAQDDEERTRVKRKITAKLTTRWEGTVKYLYDERAEREPAVVAVVEKALEFWETRTCLTFQHVDAGDINPDRDDYIVFTREGGCASYKGRIGGGQPVYIGRRCERFGIVTHEIGHALGLWHEHQRPDRDGAITIHYDNIIQNRLDNFLQCNNGTDCVSSGPYDYGSVMQYNAWSFSANDLETIEATRPGYKLTMGARKPGPQFYDVKQVVDGYQCIDSCPSVGVKCKNGGYPDVYYGCDYCMCPEGFVGDECERVQRGAPLPCGGTLYATDEYQTLASPRYPQPYPLNQKCTWLLQAPSGYKIETEFEDEFSLLTSEPCEFNFVELRLHSDKAVTGARHCGTRKPVGAELSDDGRALVLLRAHDETETKNGFRLKFRRVRDPDAKVEEDYDLGDYDFSTTAAPDTTSAGDYGDYGEYEYPGEGTDVPQTSTTTSSTTSSTTTPSTTTTPTSTSTTTPTSTSTTTPATTTTKTTTPSTTTATTTPTTTKVDLGDEADFTTTTTTPTTTVTEQTEAATPSSTTTRATTTTSSPTTTTSTTTTTTQTSTTTEATTTTETPTTTTKATSPSTTTTAATTTTTTTELPEYGEGEETTTTKAGGPTIFCDPVAQFNILKYCEDVAGNCWADPAINLDHYRICKACGKCGGVLVTKGPEEPTTTSTPVPAFKEAASTTTSTTSTTTSPSTTSTTTTPTTTASTTTQTPTTTTTSAATMTTTTSPTSTTTVDWGDEVDFLSPSPRTEAPTTSPSTTSTTTEDLGDEVDWLSSSTTQRSTTTTVDWGDEVDWASSSSTDRMTEATTQVKTSTTVDWGDEVDFMGPSTTPTTRTTQSTTIDWGDEVDFMSPTPTTKTTKTTTQTTTPADVPTTEDWFSELSTTEEWDEVTTAAPATTTEDFWAKWRGEGSAESTTSEEPTTSTRAPRVRTSGPVTAPPKDCGSLLALVCYQPGTQTCWPTILKQLENLQNMLCGQCLGCQNRPTLPGLPGLPGLPAVPDPTTTSTEAPADECELRRPQNCQSPEGRCLAGRSGWFFDRCVECGKCTGDSLTTTTTTTTTTTEAPVTEPAYCGQWRIRNRCRLPNGSCRPKNVNGLFYKQCTTCGRCGDVTTTVAPVELDGEGGAGVGLDGWEDFTSTTTTTAAPKPRFCAQRRFERRCEKADGTCRPLSWSAFYRQCQQCGKCQPKTPRPPPLLASFDRVEEPSTTQPPKEPCKEGWTLLRLGNSTEEMARRRGRASAASSSICLRRLARRWGQADGRTRCRAMRAELPSLKSRVDAMALADFLAEAKSSSSWLGLKDEDGDKRLMGERWDDGTEYKVFRSIRHRIPLEARKYRRSRGCALMNPRRRRVTLKSCGLRFPVWCARPTES